MASEKQYTFYKSLYDEENGRYILLEARAKLYTTLLSFYIGAIAFKFDDVAKFSVKYHVPVTISTAASLAFVLAVLCCVVAVLIRRYEGLTDPIETLAALPEQPQSDEEFFDERIADFAVATNRNSEQK